MTDITVKEIKSASRQLLTHWRPAPAVIYHLGRLEHWTAREERRMQFAQSLKNDFVVDK